MNTIHRNEILDKLLDWYKGAISATAMQQWAETASSSSDTAYNDWERDNTLSISREVLHELAMLDINLITTDDMPLFAEALRAPAGTAETAYIQLIDALQNINTATRRTLLKNTEPYARHCK